MVKIALPKWEREFKKRMAAQLREFAKAKDRADKLTKLTYTNGEVQYKPVKYYRSAWGRRVRNWEKERRLGAIEPIWIPKRNTNQPSV